MGAGAGKNEIPCKSGIGQPLLHKPTPTSLNTEQTLSLITIHSCLLIMLNEASTLSPDGPAVEMNHIKL